MQKENKKLLKLFKRASKDLVGEWKESICDEHKDYRKPSMLAYKTAIHEATELLKSLAEDME